MATKRSIYITKAGGPEVLQVKEEEVTELDPKKVRINVKAAGLNFAEVMARQGLYPSAPKTPCVVGYEMSGTIAEIGDEVDNFELNVGDRVFGATKFGGHSSVVDVLPSYIFAMPDKMTFAEAAAIPVNYATAHTLLYQRGNIQPGEKVLIHMCAGGVGIAALQLLKGVEDVTIFGTASSSKHDKIKEFGCTHPIDYHIVDYSEEIKKITDGEGVDLVLDALGGADFKKGYDLLRPLGRLVVFGAANFISGESRNIMNVAKQWYKTTKYSPLDIMGGNKGVLGLDMGSLFEDPRAWKCVTDILERYEEGSVKPEIHGVFPFEKANEAHACIEGRKNVGKVILVPTEEDIEEEYK